jgi:predicted phosphodiesterase
MKSYAIISDVHANLEALNAVLKKIEKAKVDRLLFLGDSVGYGPDPNECIERLQEKAKILLAGNHDWAAAGMSDITYFNPLARIAIEWTNELLSEKNIEFLQILPLTEELKDDNIFLVHATPKEPEEWHYLSYEHDARLNFNYFKENICFLGHSHVPFIVERSPKGKIKFHYDRAEIKEKNRYIVNVGSVGQPRDGNPDAAYVLLRENSIEIRRVSYDIVLTQRKMRKAGLPEDLIERLSIGR